MVEKGALNPTERELAAAMHSEWPKDAEGYPHRQAARVIPYTQSGEIFLIKGHDFGKAERAWWFTVGGGIQRGETARNAAVRELREETGLQISPARLEGPVLYRKATFYFYLETRRQDEEFFLLGVDEEEADILRRSSHRDLTPEEEKVLEESRWWSLADLAEAQAAGASLYPRALVDMAQKWVQEGSRQVFHIVES